VTTRNGYSTRFVAARRQRHQPELFRKAQICPVLEVKSEFTVSAEQ
jgi:hypothetical protein